MAMLCCVVTTVGYFGACVLHSPGNGGTGALSALRYRIADVLDGVCGVYGQINVYGVTTKSERHKRSYWTRTADGNGIGGRKAPVPYGS